MTENPHEPSATGSAKVPVQHFRNTNNLTSPGEAGIGTAGKDTTTVQEKNPDSGIPEWS
jgi:hypothetical protein